MTWTSDRPRVEQHNGRFLSHDLERALARMNAEQKPGVFLSVRHALGLAGALLGAWVLFGLVAWAVWLLVDWL